MISEFETHELLGVGIGPFNLSLAALLSPAKDIDAKFFDGRPSFVWHAGQLMPDAEIQVSYLKDLVSLVDPTNPYSFLAFLKSQKRLYRFINSRFNHVLRMEFSQYFEWVTQQLPNLHFDENVLDVKFKRCSFVMQTSKRVIRGKHLSLASGLSPNVPEAAEAHLGENVYHIKDLLRRKTNFNGKRVVVVGGGQSGAEAINFILAHSGNLPESLSWVSSRDQFSPIDDSVFANEIFTPGFTSVFHALPAENKAAMVQQQTLASDGVSGSMLEQIYRRLYFLECIEKRGRIVNFLAGHKLLQMSAGHGAYQVLLSNEKNAVKTEIGADIVILATGFRWQLPAYLDGLMDRIALDQNGQFIVNRDYSIEWDGPSEHRIYVQNAARHSHGVADPNLSLMAWRSATIINSIAERTVYDLDGESSAMDWNIIAPPQQPAPKLAYPANQVYSMPQCKQPGLQPCNPQKRSQELPLITVHRPLNIEGARHVSPH